MDYERDVDYLFSLIDQYAEREKRVLAYCADAERIYFDAGFRVPGVKDGAALISTDGVRAALAGPGEER